MATDLAEFLGAALGFYLLFGIPLFIAGLLTGLVTFLILAPRTQRLSPSRGGDHGAGERDRAPATSLEIDHRRIPTLGTRWRCSLVQPRFAGGESVLLAVGHPRRYRDAARDLPPLGAHPGPHRRPRRPRGCCAGCTASTPSTSWSRWAIAGLVNWRMLVMAAARFHALGPHRRRHARKAPTAPSSPLLGAQRPARSSRIALLASGLSSSTVGTLCGPGRDAGLPPPPDPGLAAPTS